MLVKLALKALLAIVLVVNCSAVKNLQAFAPFTKIQAENYTSISGGLVHNDCSDPSEYRVGSITNDSVIEYAGVDFEDGAEAVTLRISGYRLDYSSGNILLRLDNSSAPLFGNITTGTTGGICNWVIVNSFLTTVVSGVHNLYLTFSFVPPPGPDSDFVDIDWFYFNRTVTF